MLAGPALAPQGGIEVLFYEVLSLPLPQLERMREIKVSSGVRCLLPIRLLSAICSDPA